MGWIGIVKNPSFIVCSSPKAGLLLVENVRPLLREDKSKVGIITRQQT
jgi:hypothetical protein